MEDKREKLRGIQRKAAQRLLQSKTEIPHVTTIREVRMDSIVKLRNAINERNPDNKVSYMPFIIKAVIEGIKKYPIFNANLEGDEIVYHKNINMGVAITVGENLIVPVMHNVQDMAFEEICIKFNDLTKRARDNQLKMADFTGGTFTITNSGALGGEIFTPIINYPESAILGLGRIKEKPIVDNGNIIICPMIYLCLSYDHRIINGSQAVTLLGFIDSFLQNPNIS